MAAIDVETAMLASDLIEIAKPAERRQIAGAIHQQLDEEDGGDLGLTEILVRSLELLKSLLHLAGNGAAPGIDLRHRLGEAKTDILGDGNLCH